MILNYYVSKLALARNVGIQPKWVGKSRETFRNDSHETAENIPGIIVGNFVKIAVEIVV